MPKAVVPTEAEEQRALWQWVQLQPWAALWFHLPNERQQKREAWALAKQGVRSGLPDNWLIMRSPCGKHCGAVSELKRRNAPPSAVSTAQREWLYYLERAGFLVGVHRGWEEARDFFQAYVEGKGVQGKDDALDGQEAHGLTDEQIEQVERLYEEAGVEFAQRQRLRRDLGRLGEILGRL